MAASPIDPRIEAGLRHYAAGALEEAARSWLEVTRDHPSDRLARGYLAHLRSAAPVPIPLIEAAWGDAELGTQPVREEQGAPGGAADEDDAEPRDPTPPPSPSAGDVDEDVTVQVREPGEGADASELGAASPTDEQERSARQEPALAPLQRGAPPPAPALEGADDNEVLDVLVSGSPGSSSGLDLLMPVIKSAPPPAVAPRTALETLEAQLEECGHLHDFSGLLDAAEKLMKLSPHHAAAAEAARTAREHLTKMYLTKLQGGGGVPKLAMSPDQVIWLDLDHRAGFVLAQVDGVSTYDEIVEVTGMERLEVYRILSQLVENRVIAAL